MVAEPMIGMRWHVQGVRICCAFQQKTCNNINSKFVIGYAVTAAGVEASIQSICKDDYASALSFTCAW